nr:uncharacterized protein LOC109161295 [Ipomoea trifida]
MALRIHLLPPKHFHQHPSKSQHALIPSTYHLNNAPNLRRISCTNENKMSDSELALDLAAEVTKIKSKAVQKQEALRKSKEMLFTELCNYLGLNSEEAKKKWKRSSEEERSALIKGFVSDWAANFHPLSARSVKQLVDEYLVENPSSSGSSPSRLFPSIRKLMGFSQQEKE